MSFSPKTITGLLYIFPFIAILLLWYALIFLENPEPRYTLSYLLNETPQFIWFRWLLIAPLLCLALSGAYFSYLSQLRMGAILLFLSGLVFAFVAWFTFDSSISIFISLPLLYGYKNVRQHLTHHSSGTPDGAP
jgi:hypothetical protein